MVIVIGGPRDDVVIGAGVDEVGGTEMDALIHVIEEQDVGGSYIASLCRHVDLPAFLAKRVTVSHHDALVA